MGLVPCENFFVIRSPISHNSQQGSHFVKCGVESLGGELQRRGISRHAQWGAQGIVYAPTLLTYTADKDVPQELPEHVMRFTEPEYIEAAYLFFRCCCADGSSRSQLFSTRLQSPEPNGHIR